MASYLHKKENRKQQFALAAAGAVVIGVVGYFVYRNWQKKNETATKSCCGGSETSSQKNAHEIKTFVKDAYSEVVRDFSTTKQANANSLAQAFGYTQEELTKYGGDANMGLACGNPIAQAGLKFGDSVLDLGCGGGFDCMMAAEKVGAGGTVWGIDMSEDMINKARENARKRGIANVEYRVAEIERLPIDDNQIDCVISNCVLNLVPDKLAAFREIYRVLKPGGRLCAADIALKKELPHEMGRDLQAYWASYVNCVSGAILVEEYERLLREAGFEEVEFVDKKSNLNVWKSMYQERADQADQKVEQSSCCGPVVTEKTACCGGGAEEEPSSLMAFTPEQITAMKAELSQLDYNDFSASYYVLARK